ncbi:MAG: M12 family metallo-peptidase [Bacteroidota bacterium]
MKKFLFLPLLCLLCCSMAYAQTQSFQAQQLEYNHNELTSNLRSYDAVSLNSADIYRYATENGKDGAPFYLEIQLPNGRLLPLMLATNQSLVLEEAQVITKGEKGEKSNALANDQALYLKGAMFGVENSRVALTIADGILYGYFDNGQEVIYIEPAKYLIKDAPNDLFILYEETAVIDKGFTCGATTLEDQKEEKRSQLRMACVSRYDVQLALAADWSMTNKYASTGGITTYLNGVMNNVQANYDDEFAAEIRFIIVVYWISGCSSCDPWTTSTNSFTILSDFRNWGQAGGFGLATYDVAGFWTNRNMDGNTVGRAYINAICNTNRYHICQDYTSNAQRIRVLTAHELGHNFGGLHETGCIMNPIINTSTCWNAANVTRINNNLLTYSCLAETSCTLGSLPSTPPFPINDLCGSRTECYNLNIPCATGLFTFSSDPFLEVSSIGTTICLRSTRCSRRTSRVSVRAFDECGNSTPSVSWNISIDPSPSCCPISFCPAPAWTVCADDLLLDGLRVTWASVSGATSYEWQLVGGGSCCTRPAPVSYSGTTIGTFVNLPQSWLNRGCFTFRVRARCGRGVSAYAENCLRLCLRVAEEDIFLEQRNSEEELAAQASVESLKIAPNPNNGIFNMSLDAQEAGERVVRVIDLTGKEVWRSIKDVNAGENNIDIALPNVQNGVYILSVNDGKKVTTQKFIVNTDLR